MQYCAELRARFLLLVFVTVALCSPALGGSSRSSSKADPCYHNPTNTSFGTEMNSRTLLADSNSTTAYNSSRATSARQAELASHKPLTPVSSNDVVVFVLAGFVLFIAAGAGMGGGPVLVPIYLTLGAFSQQAAVALSNSTILAGSVANVLCNGRKRHPFKNRPLVDWDLILLMQPPTLLGAIAGSYVNKLLPGWISHVLLALLLSLMTIRVLQRASIVYRRESAPHNPTQTAGPAAAVPAVTAAPHAAAAAVPGREDAGMLTPPSAAAAPAAVTAAGNTMQLARLPADTHAGSTGAGSSSSSLARSMTAGSAARTPGSTVATGSTAVAAAGSTTSTGSTAAACSPAAAAAANAVRRASSSPLTAPAPTLSITTKPVAVAAKPLASAKVPRVSENDAVVELVALSGSRDAATACGPGECSSSSSSSIVTAERVASDGLSALAYAPPKHTRKNSWELQDDAWENDWEAWSESESPTRRHSSPADGTGDATAAAAAGGASSRFAGSSSGGGGGPAQQHDGTSQGGLLPAGHISSSIGGAAQQQKQKLQEVPPEVAAQSAEMQAILKAEAAAVPLMPGVLLVALFAAVLVTSLTSKWAGCGTAAFWVAQGAVVPVLAAIFWYSRRSVLRTVARKRAGQYDFHGDIRWTSKNSMVFPVICSLSGMIAGMFGLGGAVVLTPLMLELGVQPQVTAATTQTMLLLTSAASTITYAQMGDIPWEYAAVLLPVAFAATLAGQIALDALIKKLGRTSLVVMVLAVFFVVACGLTYFVMVQSLQVAAADVAAATVPGRICG